MDDIKERILNIQRSRSNELRNHLLSELKDEAYKTARIHCHQLGREPSDEELSIALNALNDAIDRFDQNKNTSFRTFVSKMILQRLRNYFRKEDQWEYVLYPNPNIALLSDRLSNEDTEFSEDLHEELKRFDRIIANLGYEWLDIMKNRPTHKDSLVKLQTIAIYIVNMGLGERYLKENPLSRGLRKVIGSVADRRTLKKYRPYICALVIVYLYDFPIIRSHLDSFRREVQNGTPKGNGRSDTR